MIKKLIPLLCALLIVACASKPYKIDSAATAKAAWEVEGVISDNVQCDLYTTYREICYTLFLGVTDSGSLLIQDYYKTGEKRSDPYQVSKAGLLEASDNSLSERVIHHYGQNPSIIDSIIDGFVVYYLKSGEKELEAFYINGVRNGITKRYDEGTGVRYEAHFENGRIVGVYKKWDQDGNLFYEEDFGNPHK